MNGPSARTGVSFRALRIAAQLLLCLALALLPLAAAGTAHAEGHAVAASLGHDHGAEHQSPATQTPLCHHTGACYAFVTPTAPAFAPLRAAAVPEIPRLREPASAAAHRLFRPPIAAAHI